MGQEGLGWMQEGADSRAFLEKICWEPVSAN